MSRSATLPRPELRPPQPTPTAASPTWPRRRVVLAAVGVVLLAIVARLGVTDRDVLQDLGSLVARSAADCRHLRWQFTAVVIVLGALHYIAAATATRAASGLHLRLPETIMVQLAAAAANRVTPAGIGGSAVNGRYFVRRGLSVPAAVGALAALNVLGAVADLIVFAALVLAGGVFGLNGGTHELGRLWSRLSHLVAPLRSPWLWLGLVVVVIGVSLTRARRARGKGASWRALVSPALSLGRHPRRLLVLTAASGSTTLVLALAFIASVAMVPGPQPQLSTGALLVAYLAASAVGNAVPVPAGLGATELAYIGVLVTAHVPTPQAVEIVVIFRLITFWLPAVAGVLASRQLRRTAAL
ncbi:MAG: lysylphosphatidylglycerol synthase transmembrane domain-containing protein [Jatrophihabitantaceae bacterium]